ncbi:ScbR family autoregulator-binding transcription factor [Streptomyces bauhiniae]|uniref:ScbR family autoregulator-binding transcription factor n=1 Tax=Streptomyces bauhiniae TaxID=2340725 RepID=UPI003452328F
MRHQQERSVRTRRRLLRSAAEIFDTEGYVSARLTDISARARVSTGALHFHFACKEDLARAVVEDARKVLWRAARFARPDGAEPLQALVDTSHTISRLLAWDVASRAGLRLDHGGPGDDGRRFFEAWADCVQELMTAADEQGHLLPRIQRQPLTCAIVSSTTGMGVLIKAGMGERMRVALTGFWQGFLPAIAAPEVLERLDPGGTTDLVEYAVAASCCLPYVPEEAEQAEVATRVP